MKLVRYYFKKELMQRREFFHTWLFISVLFLVSIFSIEAFSKMLPDLIVYILRGFCILTEIVVMVHATNCRLRDAGFSRWWYLLNLIPFGNIAFLVILFFFKSFPRHELLTFNNSSVAI